MAMACVLCNADESVPCRYQSWNDIFTNVLLTGIIVLWYGTWTCSPFSSVLEFVCLPWSEVCSARVTSLLLLLLLLWYVGPGRYQSLIALSYVACNYD